MFTKLLEREVWNVSVYWLHMGRDFSTYLFKDVLS